MKNNIRYARWKHLVLSMLLPALLIVSCSEISNPVSETSPSPIATATQPTSFQAQGSSSTLDIATWNLEWFGNTYNGPSDEGLQLDNIKYVISGLDMDLWAVEEVSGVSQFNDLVSQLSGYDGFVASDAFVTDGAAYYNGFGGTEQKVGLIYKSSVVSVQSAKVILKNEDYFFAGRPPVEVQLTATVNGTSQNIVMILLHAKAGAAANDRDRRETGSNALKSYLDTTWPNANVMIIGDFNDDVDKSITTPEDSPYKNFVDDSADYKVITKALSDQGFASNINYPDMIDHQLNSNELLAFYQSSSVQVFRADQYITNYGQTTSDHLPVLSNFSLTGAGSPKIFINEFEQNPVGSDTGNETIELYNPGFSDVNLSGWVLTANGGSPVSKTLSGSVPAGGYVVISNSSQWLDNSGASVTLRDANNIVIDDTPVFNDHENDNRTYQRITDGATIWEFKTATAAANNAVGSVFINEFEQNPAGTDTGNEWIEIYNANTHDLDLTGWRLTANGGSPVNKTLTGSVPAGGYVIIYNSSQWLDNSGASVTLRDGAQNLIDETPVFNDNANDNRTHQRISDGAATWGFTTATKALAN